MPTHAMCFPAQNNIFGESRILPTWEHNAILHPGRLVRWIYCSPCMQKAVKDMHGAGRVNPAPWALGFLLQLQPQLCHWSGQFDLGWRYHARKSTLKTNERQKESFLHAQQVQLFFLISYHLIILDWHIPTILVFKECYILSLPALFDWSACYLV
jgi:hypothetical protein